MNTYTNLEDQTYEVLTYGGCHWLCDTVIDSFGIQIGDDFSFSINSETAIDLVNTLQEHLKNNGIYSINYINQKCHDICHRIYIARNISLNQETIIEEFKKIDKLFRDTENYN